MDQNEFSEETQEPKPKKKSFFSLVNDLPGQVSALVRTEIDLLKAELIGKAKSAGIGVGLIAVAIPVVLLAIVVLIFAGIFALSLVMPLWAAALIVAGVLLVLAAALVVLALISFKSFSEPMPKRTISNLQSDVEVITGKKAD